MFSFLKKDKPSINKELNDMLETASWNKFPNTRKHYFPEIEAATDIVEQENIQELKEKIKDNLQQANKNKIESKEKIKNLITQSFFDKIVVPEMLSYSARGYDYCNIYFRNTLPSGILRETYNLNSFYSIDTPFKEILFTDDLIVLCKNEITKRGFQASFHEKETYSGEPGRHFETIDEMKFVIIIHIKLT